jgi:23S rRNA (cytidine1920-2'-O)/16S rRNA (cytidine1409-2'-O)-methyltransferase
MTVHKKIRLDQVIGNQRPDLSRTLIQSLIIQGKVTIDGVIITKPGTQVSPESTITIDAQTPKYVSRGGFKLEAALDHFKLDVSGLIALDAGISTGGFTDCLLQNNISHVYGIDVGYGQVHEKIKDNPRVTILEKTNLRHLEKLPHPIDLATLDLSFISLLKIMPALSTLLKPTSMIIALIKPQFEAERHEISRGGIVKNQEVHERVIQKIITGMLPFGFTCKGVIESPILGGQSGNKEFLGLFVREQNPSTT